MKLNYFCDGLDNDGVELDTASLAPGFTFQDLARALSRSMKEKYPDTPPLMINPVFSRYSFDIGSANIELNSEKLPELLGLGTKTMVYSVNFETQCSIVEEDYPLYLDMVLWKNGKFTDLEECRNHDEVAACVVQNMRRDCLLSVLPGNLKVSMMQHSSGSPFYVMIENASDPTMHCAISIVNVRKVPEDLSEIKVIVDDIEQFRNILQTLGMVGQFKQFVDGCLNKMDELDRVVVGTKADAVRGTSSSNDVAARGSSSGGPTGDVPNDVAARRSVAHGGAGGSVDYDDIIRRDFQTIKAAIEEYKKDIDLVSFQRFQKTFDEVRYSSHYKGDEGEPRLLQLLTLRDENRHTLVHMAAAVPCPDINYDILWRYLSVSEAWLNIVLTNDQSTPSQLAIAGGYGPEYRKLLRTLFDNSSFCFRDDIEKVLFGENSDLDSDPAYISYEVTPSDRDSYEYSYGRRDVEKSAAMGSKTKFRSNFCDVVKLGLLPVVDPLAAVMPVMVVGDVSGVFDKRGYVAIERDVREELISDVRSMLERSGRMESEEIISDFVDRIAPYLTLEGSGYGLNIDLASQKNEILRGTRFHDSQVALCDLIIPLIREKDDGSRILNFNQNTVSMLSVSQVAGKEKLVR